MTDAGIIVSDGQVEAAQAAGTGLFFSSKYPFAKIDSTKSTSLQNVVLTFQHDPPNPDGVISYAQDTTVYSFAHTYKYTPKLWMLFRRTIGQAVQSGPSFTRDVPYGYEGSIITQSTVSDFAQYATIKLNADTNNVYLIVTKNYRTGGSYVDPAVSLVGYQIKCRIYVFVEDMLGS